MGTIPASENVYPIVRMAEAAAPGTPPAGEAHLYVKADGILYWKDDAGNEYSAYSDVAAHLADATDAHDASAISVLDTGALYAATDVEAALAEVATTASGHIADSSDAHDASAVSIVDSGAYFTGTDVEAALQELGAGAGGGGGALYPLDGYSLDGTYGDHFDSASLAAIWTRRNFTSGAEQRQYGPAATHIRINTNGRAAGDGYFQTAPGGDWTFAMKHTQQSHAGGAQQLAPCVVDSSGNGVVIAMYTSPDALLAEALTTYGYGGSFTQLQGWNASYLNIPMRIWLPTWTYIRKSGTNYYGAVSFDGETWSDETPAKSWAGTVDRVGMIAPLGFSAASYNYVVVDWFNKIA
jgi:hypothetical protein